MQVFEGCLHLEGTVGSVFVVVLEETYDLLDGWMIGIGNGSVEFFLDGSMGAFDASVVAGCSYGYEGLLDAVGP